MIGRKYTFLITMLRLMGVGTFFIARPTLGIIAPVILIGLRLAQGPAPVATRGAAAIYVAEHAPKNKRGLYLWWIQTTATLGLFMALLLVLWYSQCSRRTHLRAGAGESRSCSRLSCLQSRSGSGSGSMSCRSSSA